MHRNCEYMIMADIGRRLLFSKIKTTIRTNIGINRICHRKLSAGIFRPKGKSVCVRASLKTNMAVGDLLPLLIRALQAISPLSSFHSFALRLLVRPLIANMLQTKSLLSAEEVHQALSKCLEREPDAVTGFELSPKSESVIGYMGSHFSLVIDYVMGGQPNRKRFFVKTFDFNEKENYFLDETGIFQKEVDFYKVVVEDVRKNVGEPTWCPKYCFSKKRVLVLEDISDLGFEMFDGNVTLNEDHVKMALTTLARMHASSMVLEKRIQVESLSAEYFPFFEEVLYVENSPERATSKWISWQIKDLLEGIERLDNYTEDERDTIKKKFPDEIMRIYPLNKVSTKFRNVITHGDVWKNNLMFRYEAGRPCDCRLVDFQFIRYAPPSHDVLNFLHMATRKATRDENMSYLLEYYYECLAGEFDSKGLNSEDELPKDEFMTACAYYKELALIQSLLSMHYILGPVTLNVDQDDHQKYEEYLTENRQRYMEEFFKREPYSSKIKEGLTELIDNYILKR